MGFVIISEEFAVKLFAWFATIGIMISLFRLFQRTSPEEKKHKKEFKALYKRTCKKPYKLPFWETKWFHGIILLFPVLGVVIACLAAQYKDTTFFWVMMVFVSVPAIVNMLIFAYFWYGLHQLNKFAKKHGFDPKPKEERRYDVYCIKKHEDREFKAISSRWSEDIWIIGFSLFFIALFIFPIFAFDNFYGGMAAAFDKWSFLLKYIFGLVWLAMLFVSAAAIFEVLFKRYIEVDIDDREITIAFCGMPYKTYPLDEVFSELIIKRNNLLPSPSFKENYSITLVSEVKKIPDGILLEECPNLTAAKSFQKEMGKLLKVKITKFEDK